MKSDKEIRENLDENWSAYGENHTAHNSVLIVELLLDIRKILRDNKKICKK